MTDGMKAQARAESGKGVARRLRNAGMVPAVIYGSGKEPQAVAVDGHDLFITMQKGGFFTQIHTLNVDGKDEKVLARDVQRHPVKDLVEHVDFLRFDPNRKIKVMVSVRVMNEDQSPGLEKGGVLSLVRNEVELLCRADSIPEYIEVDMTGVNIGESAKISNVELPDGVEPTINDRDFAIASVVSTRTSKSSDEDEEGEATEGEEGAEAEASEEGEAKAEE